MQQFDIRKSNGTKQKGAPDMSGAPLKFFAKDFEMSARGG